MKILQQFVKNPKTTGSVAPSSRSLIKKMLAPVDFSRVKTIVEFGPGDGCITREILRRMRKDATLYSFEINNELESELRKITDSRFVLIHDLAENLLHHLSIESVDTVISGIPINSFSKQRLDLLYSRTKKVLKKDGQYVQFQYLPLQLNVVKEHFSVNLAFTPFNIPPAFVYVCEKIE